MFIFFQSTAITPSSLNFLPVRNRVEIIKCIVVYVWIIVGAINVALGACACAIGLAILDLLTILWKLHGVFGQIFVVFGQSSWVFFAIFLVSIIH